jgi:predicted nucleic acid-binding protein
MAALVLADLEASTSTTVVRVDVGDELRAREIVYGYTDKDFSPTDAIGFAVMERPGISQAFTLDRTFVQSGWAVLDPTTGR